MLADGGGGAPYDVDGCCGDATTVGSMGVG